MTCCIFQLLFRKLDKILHNLAKFCDRHGLFSWSYHLSKWFFADKRLISKIIWWVIFWNLSISIYWIEWWYLISKFLHFSISYQWKTPYQWRAAFFNYCFGNQTKFCIFWQNFVIIMGCFHGLITFRNLFLLISALSVK